jgi:ParB family chromosome partitioning protein
VSEVKQTPKSHGLGKGFESLLPQGFDTDLLLDPTERVQKLPIDSLIPNPQQPRHHFDKESLQELSQSIKQYGILQPLIVTEGQAANYEIVAGERRWRAAQLIGLDKVPVIIRSTKELERLEIALVENVQRVDLSPLEQAASMERLHQQFSLSYSIIAKRLNKALSTINNMVRLLQLPPNAQEALQKQTITEGHARQILSLKDYPAKQEELLRLTIKNHWSVRQIERYVTAFKAGTPDTSTKIVRNRMRSETASTKKLAKKLSTPVTIRRTAHGGKLEIGFTDESNLERLLKLLLDTKN